MENKNLKEKEYYKEKIIEIIEKIENINFLEKIYYFIKAFLEE